MVDKHNKPDLRFLFEDKQQAVDKLHKIKNSIKGETIFLPNNRRDFFVDGINRSFIEPGQPAAVKKGCWSSMKIKKVSLVDNIKPENLFAEIEKSSAHSFAYSKSQIKEIKAFKKAKSVSLPDFSKFKAKEQDYIEEKEVASAPLVGPAFGFKSLVGAMTVLCLVAFSSVLTINYRAANEANDILLAAQSEVAKKTAENQTVVLGAKDKKLADQFEGKFDEFVISSLSQFESVKTEELEGEIMKIVAGSPMEKMAPLIAKEDRKVAAFLVGIAKKESNLGRRVPVLNGKDCYNYWGYRGARDRMGSGGHTCFDSPEDAIATVGGRLKRLVQSDVDTPAEMVLWKCGSNCAKDAGAKKWISDVDTYFNKIENNS